MAERIATMSDCYSNTGPRVEEILVPNMYGTHIWKFKQSVIMSSCQPANEYTFTVRSYDMYNVQSERMISASLANNVYTEFFCKQSKLEQPESLRSEIPPAAPWLPILVIHTRSPSQNKTMSKLQILKNCQKCKSYIFARNFTCATPSKLA